MKSTENRPKILLLTGPRGAGKTTWVLGFARFLKDRQHPVFGVATPKIFEDDAPEGIAVCDLATGVQMPLAHRDDFAGVRIGPWRFEPDAMAFANNACNPHLHTGLALIDEIGPLELGGSGFQVAFDALKSGLYPSALVVVRPELLEALSKVIFHDGEMKIIGPEWDYEQTLTLFG